MSAAPAIVGVGDRLERESRQLVGGVADNFAERPIDTDEVPIECDQRHPDGCFIERELESLLRFLQRPFDAFALSDVPHERLPTTVRQNIRTHFDRDERSVLPLQGPLAPLHASWNQKFGPDRLQPGSVFGWNDLEDCLANQHVPSS